ncbi:ABC exporter membrane fusion protein [Gloeocapsopsis dulcis]|uniref:HlyD family secretion protein n=1 Tax=Gloeocapsopsis dulcis AAB1 = 1H9 TaxID=1433147 RepID=A0A6N8FSX9_9CHRO|nr:ABC exporter membrane fusion protein [Gloeocapsopsis dulcis]MUL35056.1 HlyD family secretion protein [Gloeocapsopsis dulcis AAB1 = 1H9]WNN89866.1 ABC exporter membrane fusion protein [Gloeocapsopsis dulcis]
MFQSSVSDKQIIKPVFRRVTILAVIGAVATGGIIYAVSRFQVRQSPAPPPTVSVPQVRVVTALGRLEPYQEVIQLSAPVSSEGSRVDELLVKQGDQVSKGQIVAILDSRDRLLTALEQAQQQVKVAQTRLAQVKAGAKSGEINAQQATISRIEVEKQEETKAQQATIARLDAEVRNAQLEYLRYQKLYQEGAISTSERDSKQLTLQTVQQQLNEAQANLNRITRSRQEQVGEAKATLDQIAEVRPVDVAAAQAEVDSAIVAVKQAQANLDLAYVRSPRDGQIMKIHAWSGEVIGNDGVVDIGQTDQMYVVAEVYESDIQKVRPGQNVTITSSAFTEKLQGEVDEIGLAIGKKDVLDTDPTANIDSRVVEVKIRLDPEASQQVSGLTNMQVKTVIEL